MSTCTACGKANRDYAHYCRYCSAPLTRDRSAEAHQRWLAARLAEADPPHPAPPVAIFEEECMDQPTPDSPLRFADRFEIVPGTDPDAVPELALGSVVVRDTAPWQRCWACGSTANEAGEAFCTDCGAALEQREYAAFLTSTEAPTGVVLAADVTDPAAADLLPPIWERVEDGAYVLAIVHDSGRPAITTPLDETTALLVGSSLVKLLEALHNQSIALGALTPAHLEALAGGIARLRDAPNMRRFTAEEAADATAVDLQALAELLEQLTATPRTTQRLSEDEAAEAIETGEATLSSLLRQVRTGAITTASELGDRLEALLAERTHPIPLVQSVGAATDVGIVRDHNEDSFLTISLGLNNDSTAQRWGVYIVSDGMGGHAAGELASGLAVRGAAELVLSEYLTQAMAIGSTFDVTAARDVVERAVLQANMAIVREGQAQGNDMGATLTMALVVGDRALIGNVGDSRAYLYRDGKLRRVTNDHSLVMRLVELGQISEEDIYSHPQRNAVLRSLGDREAVEVDVFVERVRPGDALLLCSDGQWEMTRDAEMERYLARPDDPNVVCHALVAAANQAGGEDNICVVLVRFSEA
jgi:PPM family protein phosphatase